MREKKEQIRMLPMVGRLTPLVFRQAPVLSVWMILLAGLHSLAQMVSVPVNQICFDRVTALAQGEAGLPYALWGLLLVGAAGILREAMNGIDNYLMNVYFEKVAGKLQKIFHDKASRLAPADFEDTEKLDAMEKALKGKDNAVFFVGMLIMAVCFYGVYFFAMGWYLFTLKPILAASIVLVFVPVALSQMVKTKVFAKVEDEAAPLRRETDHYALCIGGREFFKETRLLGAFGHFWKLFRDTLAKLQKKEWSAQVKTGLLEMGMNLLAALGYVGILLLLLDALLKGEITVGAFAAVFGSIGMLFGIMREVVCRHVGQITQSLGTVHNFVKFLDMPERGGQQGEVPEHFDVVLDNVSFSYPHGEKRAVDRVSLRIADGETLAIVGENGSGKSTLVRLLTGLYSPQEGTVRFGGADVSTLSMGTVFSRISGVFQKFQRYQMTLRENIGISLPGGKRDDESLAPACRLADVDPADRDFPQGMDTMLSREFDGVDLSGGEWQRVAIARGFRRPHSLIVLDEPTAAIDPDEETKVFHRFAKMAQGKTAVIVTHRLGSAKLADRIVVMKEGRICQSGTHEELLAAGGEYARMYKTQEQWYRQNTAEAAL
ncbi:MAG: ABC transporter ATP-binding protein [Oscillospiraceae bacterium]|jgi:ATP-binding cassette subfamily B protein|nr:ABC transporter ATP-binding protein [Oscillospiraceae bacterium]